MQEKVFNTRKGPIHYWVNDIVERGQAPTLVFLPGLTADHRLFNRQIAYFKESFPILVWDAPGHGQSRPFSLTFDLNELASWLDRILKYEKISRPLLIGQSLGGYIAQAFIALFPTRACGLVAIDSGPLAKGYTSAAERLLLKRIGPFYRYCAWPWLLEAGPAACATTPYGQDLMRGMMMSYDGRQVEYAALAGHGYRMLAEALENSRPFQMDCPALLICGSEDVAGSSKRLNQAWHDRTGLPLVMVDGAGHNANTDKPNEVNRLIELFIRHSCLA